MWFFNINDNNHNKQYFYKETSDRVKKFRNSEPDFIDKLR
jgi:hypothetical protein